jgi:hypothetical protein
MGVFVISICGSASSRERYVSLGLRPKRYCLVGIMGFLVRNPCRAWMVGLQDFCVLCSVGRDFAKVRSPSQGVLHKITATIVCKQKACLTWNTGSTAGVYPPYIKNILHTG